MTRVLANACVTSVAVLALIVPVAAQEGEWGDAPEGAVAYPNLNPQVTGQFPTCLNVPLASFIYHGPLCWAHFPGAPPPFDFETEGNAGNCPNFPPYDADECFMVDAGLMFPDPYTIDAQQNVVPCPQGVGTSLGNVCTVANWGTNLDIVVSNVTFVWDYYVNVIIDWDQSGTWGGSVNCPGVGAAVEHVLVNFIVPFGYIGPLSGLGPPPFRIGPRDEFVWARFTISEVPVSIPWDGSGTFEDGETEDYLLQVYDPNPVEPGSWGTIKGLYR